MNKYIKRIPIFSDLDEELLEKISGIVRIKSLNEGDNIFFDSEPYRGFYAVLKGLVKIYKISRDGKEHIIHIIGPFNTFAEAPLLENLENIIEEDFRYPANSMAIEDSTEVMLIPAMEFREILRNDINISLHMLSGLAKRLKHMNRHIEELTLKDVTKRTAAFILNEYRKITNQSSSEDKLISLHMNRSDLASYLGTAIETLSRTLGKLQSDGIIEVTGRNILVKELEKLSEISSS